MKRNRNKYEIVNQLPGNAVTVAEYARNEGYTTNYIYNRVRSGKELNFKIVIFQSFNFIIPTK